MDALDKHSEPGDAFLRRKIQRVVVKLVQIAADAEAAGAGAGDDTRTGDGGEALNGSDKLLEFSQEQRADFVEGFVVESEFDNAIAPFPVEAFATEFFYGEKIAAVFLHALVPSATACLLYSWSISCWKRLLIASRFSFPFAVSSAFSGVNTSWRIVKLRTWR